MILLIIVILVALLIYFQNNGEDEGAFVMGVFILIMLCFGAWNLYSIASVGNTTENKIQLYESQNKEIDSNMEELVADYKDYESSVIEMVKGKSSEEILLTFPELKSSSLAAQQIDVYMGNKRKINELREKQIDLSKNKWWLYFGK